MRMLIKMKWNEGKQQWHMLHGINGKFIQEVYDCENTHKIFDGLDRTRAKTYFMQVEVYEKWNEKRGLR